ncbi:MAG: cyclic pyranopterin monophosphate synthase MoaC [Actinomycetota bacterium]
MSRLSHIGPSGRAAMVDVSGKLPARRSAKAAATVMMPATVVSMITGEKFSKGDVVGVARIAGIMAAKKTPELIPLCHPLGLDSISIDLTPFADERGSGIDIVAEVATTEKTGVEMEALVAASVAALTVYDMCKSADKSITIEKVRLIEKTGGKSGGYRLGQ